MKIIEHRHLFRDQNPPPGGPERLRRQMASRPARPMSLPFTLAAVGLMCGMAVILWRFTAPSEPSRLPPIEASFAFARLLQQEIDPTDALDVSIDERRIQPRLASSTARVRIYQLPPDRTEG